MFRSRATRFRPSLLPTILFIAGFLFLVIPIFLVAVTFPRTHSTLSTHPGHIWRNSLPQKYAPKSKHDFESPFKKKFIVHFPLSNFSGDSPRTLASRISHKIAASQDVLVKLTQNEGKNSVMMAGLPRFRANFARDSLVSAMLMNNITMLLRQLRFSMQYQGRKKNAYTGEEFGKIAHEIPGAILNGKSTQYAACDTTALFVIGISRLLDALRNSSGYSEIQTEFSPALVAGVRYIVSHLRAGLFTEIPELSGAKEFALPVTYWKDLQHYGTCTKPTIPAVYTLAHVMNLRALVLAVPLLTREVLQELQIQQQIIDMRKGLERLWNPELGMFNLAQTESCSVAGVASDSLHALYYLEPYTDLSREKAASIALASKSLETEIGYKNEIGPEGYHSNNVWPFEQAIIHEGALQHELNETALVAARMFTTLALVPQDEFPEYFSLPLVKVAGCNFQLWTVAAFRYFFKNSLFKCDHNDTIPFQWVNDNYCDCRDASDEPDTSACSNGKFVCEADAQVLPASRVGDGIEDCVDGSDELTFTFLSFENDEL